MAVPLNGNETLEVLGQDNSGKPAAVTQVNTTGDIARISNLTRTKYGAAANTAGFTATGAQVSGAASVTLDLTGAMAADANVQFPTAANLVAAISNAQVGQSYTLRIINSSSVNHVWTLTTNTGITLAGTMTMAQNTFRDFYVTLTSLTAVSVQSVGTGIQS